MKKVLFGLSFLLIYGATAQSPNLPNEDPNTYFNSFQNFTNTSLNQDSALYCMQKLASSPAYEHLLKMLLHDSFAQRFRQNNVETDDTSESYARNRQLVFGKELLLKLVSDSNNVLQQSARPLYLLSEVQDNSSDPVALTNLTNEFIKKELLSGNIYDNRQARYGLLIHQIVSKQENLKPIAQKLLLTLKTSLKNGQIKLTDSTSRLDLDKRAWYRYLYAYINDREAKGSVNVPQKALLLKKAFDYSPDLVDRNHRAAYFYDMMLLFGEEKESFREGYLDFLKSTATNKNKVLSTLLETALVAPEYRDKLEAYYSKSNLMRKPFSEYWRAAINKGAKAAPSISLTLLDGKPILNKNLLGKWVLIDFWGTWCIPCREEHPALEKFYKSTVLQKPNAISLVTVACKDARDRVTKYMEQKKFTFPVAMADDRIEKAYQVQGYPTKLLITPEGKYIVVPFGVDWENFVKQYSGI